MAIIAILIDGKTSSGEGRVEKKILHKERGILLKNIEGKVIELGAGTGVNFEFYSKYKITAVEPDESLSIEAEKKICFLLTDCAFFEDQRMIKKILEGYRSTKRKYRRN